MISSLRHRLYLRAQRRQSLAKRHKDASFRLVPFVMRCTPHLPPKAKVLCLGARNYVELDLFRSEEARPFGLDLIQPGLVNALHGYCGSNIPAWVVGDMHDLPFKTGSFDLVFASHAIEHARQIGRVAQEMARAAKPAGLVFVAVPTSFRPSWHDRYAFGDVPEITRHFPRPVKILDQRRIDPPAPGQPGELSFLARFL